MSSQRFAEPDLTAYETLDDEPPRPAARSGPKRYKAGTSFNPKSNEDKLREELERRRAERQADRLARGQRLEKRNEFERGYNFRDKLSANQEKAIRDEWYGKGMYWGRDKLYKLLLERPDLQNELISRRQVISWLVKQESYQRHLPFKPDTNVHKSIYPMKPGVLQLDNLTFGNVTIFMAIDVFTHYVWAFKHTGAAGAVASAEYVKEIDNDMKEAGYPQGIRMVWTDAGSEFVDTKTKKANEFRSTMDELGLKEIKHMVNPTKTHAHHVERANRTLRMLLSKTLEGRRRKADEN